MIRTCSARATPRTTSVMESVTAGRGERTTVWMRSTANTSATQTLTSSVQAPISAFQNHGYVILISPLMMGTSFKQGRWDAT